MSNYLTKGSHVKFLFYIQYCVLRKVLLDIVIVLVQLALLYVAPCSSDVIAFSTYESTQEFVEERKLFQAGCILETQVFKS